VKLCQPEGGTQMKVSENRVLKRILGPERVEATENQRKYLNEERHNLYPSPNFIRMSSSRRLDGWVL
jgi:hypothetical protein